MSTIPVLTVTPSAAVNAYARVQSGAAGMESDAAAGSFGDMLSRAVQGVADAGHKADAQSARAISGAGNVTEVATAVTRAELAFQTVIAVRDKVIQAYQDVARMPI